MMKNFIEELKWRGMLQDIMPGTEEQLQKEMTSGYIGFDPTADSLGIGNLVQVMVLKFFQECGHKPIALVGGATGMVGDPSGKSAERNLLSAEQIQLNLDGQRKQLEKFLDFNSGANAAEVVNNYDWFKNITMLEFLRDVGKHITVSYMMSKDSVQKRLETGLSYTEFAYQLLQGYDFYHLYNNNNCKIQMGGSDQWGNIVTGTELIRRKGGGQAFALTCPLIAKEDGSKFGKTEKGNIWLDPKKTSPYTFYQFWLNASDNDAAKYIRIFTMKTRAEVEALEAEHQQAPHLRALQKALAADVTTRVHAEADLNAAIEASEILFGKGTTEALKGLSEAMLLDVFDGVPQFICAKSELEAGINVIDLLAERTQVFPSKGEARKMLQAGGVAINKQKLENIDAMITTEVLIQGKYFLVQKGKKNYYLLIAE